MKHTLLLIILWLLLVILGFTVVATEHSAPVILSLTIASYMLYIRLTDE